MSDFRPIKFAFPEVLEARPPSTPFILFDALKRKSPSDFSPFCHGHFGWYSGGREQSTFIATDIRPDCVQFNTTQFRDFGVQVAHNDDFRAALVFDEVNGMGLTVRCRGSFKREIATRGSVWAARPEAARKMYITLERFRDSRTQILPEELRVLAAASKANPNNTPESFLVAEYYPHEVEYLFLGGGDRCHTALRYKRRPGCSPGTWVWETAGFHVA